MNDGIGKQKRKRVSFPYIGIGEAIGVIQKLKSAEGFADVPVELALKKMGYTPTSSSADRVLSALIGYQLLNTRGSKGSKFVSLSNLSKQILLNSDGSPDYRMAVKQAALNDKIMERAIEKWKDGLPSRENIIKTLMLDPDFDFTDRAASRFSSVLIETFEVLELPSYYDSTKQNFPDDSVAVDAFSPNEQVEISQQKSWLSDYSFPLDVRRKVILRAPADLTEDEFKRVLQWLEIMKPGLVRKQKNEEENDIPF